MTSTKRYTKAQIETIALVGIAILALAALAYFFFFAKAPHYQKPLIEVTAKNKSVCVNGAALVQVTVLNPASNPPAAITFNAKAKDSTVAAVMDGAPVTLPFTVLLPPGDFVVLNLYVSPHTAGQHVVQVYVSYLLRGMEKPATEVYKVTINAVNCG